MFQNLTESDRAERVVLRSLAMPPHGAEPDKGAAALSAEGLAGFVAAREDARLTVELDTSNPAESLSVGALVEVRSPAVLYLGQVRAVRGSRLTIILEHSVNLDSLAAIQRIWNRPDPVESHHSATSGSTLSRNGSPGR